MLTTREHYELIEMFERTFKGCGRLDKEEKALWTKGIVYQDGKVNQIFLAYRHGYAYGKTVEN